MQVKQSSIVYTENEKVVGILHFVFITERDDDYNDVDDEETKIQCNNQILLNNK